MSSLEPFFTCSGCGRQFNRLVAPTPADTPVCSDCFPRYYGSNNREAHIHYRKTLSARLARLIDLMESQASLPDHDRLNEAGEKMVRAAIVATMREANLTQEIINSLPDRSGYRGAKYGRNY